MDPSSASASTPTPESIFCFCLGSDGGDQPLELTSEFKGPTIGRQVSMDNQVLRTGTCPFYTMLLIGYIGQSDSGFENSAYYIGKVPLIGDWNLEADESWTYHRFEGVWVGP